MTAFESMIHEAIEEAINEGVEDFEITEVHATSCIYQLPAVKETVRNAPINGCRRLLGRLRGWGNKYH